MDVNDKPELRGQGKNIGLEIISRSPDLMEINTFEALTVVKDDVMFNLLEKKGKKGRGSSAIIHITF